MVVLGLPCLLRTTCRSFSIYFHHVSNLHVPFQGVDLQRKPTFVPICHIILLLRFFLSLPRILIQVLLLPFPLYSQIMAKFALPPLLAIALLVKLT